MTKPISGPLGIARRLQKYGIREKQSHEESAINTGTPKQKVINEKIEQYERELIYEASFTYTDAEGENITEKNIDAVITHLRLSSVENFIFYSAQKVSKLLNGVTIIAEEGIEKEVSPKEIVEHVLDHYDSLGIKIPMNEIEKPKAVQMLVASLSRKVGNTLP